MWSATPYQHHECKMPWRTVRGWRLSCAAEPLRCCTSCSSLLTQAVARLLLQHETGDLHTQASMSALGHIVCQRVLHTMSSQYTGMPERSCGGAAVLAHGQPVAAHAVRHDTHLLRQHARATSSSQN